MIFREWPIDAERAPLADVADALSTIASELGELSAMSFRTSFGALDAYRSRLDVLERKCETISNRRQRTILK